MKAHIFNGLRDIRYESYNDPIMIVSNGAFVDNGRDTTLTDVTLGGITGPFNAVVPRHVPTTAAAVLFTNEIASGGEISNNFINVIQPEPVDTIASD